MILLCVTVYIIVLTLKNWGLDKHLPLCGEIQLTINWWLYPTNSKNHRVEAGVEDGVGVGYTVSRLSVIPSFRLHFRSISWERIDGIIPNLAYALTFARSTLGLLRVNFLKYATRLWPLIIVKIVKILFPLNILWMNRQNLIKVCICIDLNQI